MGGGGGGRRSESPTPEIKHKHSISRVVEVVAEEGRPHPRNQAQKLDFVGGGGGGRRRESPTPKIKHEGSISWVVVVVAGWQQKIPEIRGEGRGQACRNRKGQALLFTLKRQGRGRPFCLCQNREGRDKPCCLCQRKTMEGGGYVPPPCCALDCCQLH